MFKELVLIIELVAKPKPIAFVHHFTTIGWLFGHMGLWGSLGSGIGSDFEGQHCKIFIFIEVSFVLGLNC